MNTYDVKTKAYQMQKPRLCVLISWHIFHGVKRRKATPYRITLKSYFPYRIIAFTWKTVYNDKLKLGSPLRRKTGNTDIHHVCQWLRHDCHPSQPGKGTMKQENKNKLTTTSKHPPLQKNLDKIKTIWVYNFIAQWINRMSKKMGNGLKYTMYFVLKQ